MGNESLPVAHFDYCELHLISLRSVSCNLMILLFCTHSCTLFCNDYIFFYKNRCNAPPFRQNPRDRFGRQWRIDSKPEQR